MKECRHMDKLELKKSYYTLFDIIFKNGSYEAFMDFAYFMHLHKNLSVFNSCLIYAQKPGSIFTATEEEWKRKYDRSVKPDATPIVVLRTFGPVMFVYEAIDTYCEDGSAPPDFMTDAQILTDIDPPNPLDDYDLDLVQKDLHEHGIYYGEKSLGSGVAGSIIIGKPPMSWYVKRKKLEKQKDGTKKYVERDELIKTRYFITVNKNHEPHDKIMTVLHELGHLFCSHIGADEENKIIKIRDREGIERTEEQDECEAETVCQLFCKKYDIVHDSEKYKNQYAKNGVLPYISMRAVVDAVDKIGTILPRWTNHLRWRWRLY